MKTARRLFNTCLIRPADLKPSQDDLEVIGVFNPGAVATESGVILLLRVAEQASERRDGFSSLPRWNPEESKVIIDWEEIRKAVPVDVRVVKRTHDQLARLTFTSHFRVAHSRDGRAIDSVSGPCFLPANEYEEFGVEDPRITRIGDMFYFTYVAVSRHGVAVSLATTKDFRSFQRQGLIFYPENKDVVLFPEKIGGRFYALHRPFGATPFTKPEMWLADSPDLVHWGHNQYFLGGTEAWDIGRIGAGTPPIRTSDGWLELYHGNSRSDENAGIGTYSCGALLLDLEHPERILGASGSIFMPKTKFECNGFVPNVVFPTGIVEQGENVLVYYGAADTCSAVVEFSLKELLGLVKRKQDASVPPKKSNPRRRSPAAAHAAR
jgi:predicted GH43/DUF377 family glycosyl hydrolase